MKAAAEPFYDRLVQQRFVNAAPWTGKEATASDYALANSGMIKNLFSFDVALDTDGDGLPDMWEMLAFGNLSQTGSMDFDGDSLSNLDEFRLGTKANSSDSDNDGVTDQNERTAGTDPNDFFNGTPPAAPTDVRAERTDGNRVAVTWNNVAQGIKKFDIERTSDGRTWQRIGHVAGNIRQFTDPTPSLPNVVAFYGVTAIR